jgi:homoserine O-acetyltransferase
MKHCIRVLLITLVVLLTTTAARGQCTLTFFQLGDFRLENGQTIRDCRVGYRTFGILNPDKSNAVLVPTWFEGTTQDLTDLEIIGPGKLVDSSQYFVIAVEAFGNGVSSSPSNSTVQPGPAFPRFSIRDMVNAQHFLLSKELHLSHLYAVIGISMGGMQTFQWMVSYPEFLEKAIPIVGTPRLSSYDLLVMQAELRAIEATRNCKDGDTLAMQTVADIHALLTRTPHYLVMHTSPEEFPQFLAASEKNIMRFNVNDWAWQLKAMMAHDICKPFEGSVERAATAVHARVLVVVSQQDHLVTPESARVFAKLLKAETFELTSDCGHFSFLCEGEILRTAVTRFLNK